MQIASESEMLIVAAQLAKLIENHFLLFLQGPLGAGKTTFVRGFLQSMGVSEKVKSPTYSLVETYEVAGKRILHCDFYRLSHPREIEFIGMLDEINSHAIFLIEWPEIAVSLFPPPDLIIEFKINNHDRELLLVAHTARGQQLLEKWEKKA